MIHLLPVLGLKCGNIGITVENASYDNLTGNNPGSGLRAWSAASIYPNVTFNGSGKRI